MHFHHQPQAVERQFVLELSSHKEAHVKLFDMGLDGADVVGFCYRLWTCFNKDKSQWRSLMHFELPTLIGMNRRKGDTVMDEAIKYAKPNMEIFAKWHAHLKYVSTYGSYRWLLSALFGPCHPTFRFAWEPQDLAQRLERVREVHSGNVTTDTNVVPHEQ